MGPIEDPTAFLWMVRPRVNLFEIKNEETTAIEAEVHWGPRFGNGDDLWISDKCNVDNNNGCIPESFEFDVKDLCGNDVEDWLVKEYEVFSVLIK